MFYPLLSLALLAAHAHAFPTLIGFFSGVSIRPVSMQQFCMLPDVGDSQKGGPASITFPTCDDSNHVYTLFLNGNSTSEPNTVSETKILDALNSLCLDWQGGSSTPNFQVNASSSSPQQQWTFTNRGQITNAQDSGDAKCLTVGVGTVPGAVTMEECLTLADPATNSDSTGQAWMIYSQT